MPISYVYGAEDAKPDFLPEDIYPAEILEAKAGVSKAGNNKINIAWKCDNGHRIWDDIVDLPNCRWKSNQLAAALGIKIEDKKAVVIDENDIIGGHANLRLTVVDGKNKVAEYLPINDPKESGEPGPF